MDSRSRLEQELFRQDFSFSADRDDILGRYKQIASGYAAIENVIAVLSDMRRNVSYIYAGRFASTLGQTVDTDGISESSIWEESLFKLIHPEDLARKHIEELLFFNMMRRLPARQRNDYYLMSRLRMRTPTSGYIPALHRMHYVQEPEKDSLWLALCLYGPLSVDFTGRCYSVNSVNGSKKEITPDDSSGILSDREKQVLQFVDKGCSSKEIAEILSISKNTVSRHRQEIISKLQTKNSLEACRVAKAMRII